MTKWIIGTCFFLISNIILAQKSTTDTLSPQKASQGILSREISFSNHEGKLEDVLSKLSSEQNIKFSYSHDRIQHVSVKGKTYSSSRLADLLSALLKHTGFNYLLVGRIIVIVEDDKNLKQSADSVITPASSSVKFPDSTHTHPNETSKPVSDSSPTVNSFKIYSPDLNLAKLPASERRKIQKIYREELKWAYHFNKFRLRTNDTLNKSKHLPLPATYDVHDEARYYISGSLGLLHYGSGIKGNKDISWKEDLDYHRTIKPAIRPEIRAGFMTRSVMMNAGIGYQQIKVNEQGTFIYKKSNGIGQGQGNQPDTFNYSYSDKYSVFSLPLEIFLFKQRKKLFAGIGTKIELDFIHKNAENDRFKTYYESKVKDGIYSEKNNKMALASSLKVQAGVFVQNNLAMAAGVTYNYYITPFTKNSIYTFYPNSFQFEISLFYFLSKSM